MKNFNPLPTYVLLPIFARTLRESGQPVVFRAQGWRVGSGLEISVYQGGQWVTTFAAQPPSAALTALVNFGRAVRAAGVPCRITLSVYPGQSPF